jgi:hypothetical protein
LIGYKSRSQKKSLPHFFLELDWASFLLGFHFISLIPKEVPCVLPSTTNPNLKKKRTNPNPSFGTWVLMEVPKRSVNPPESIPLFFPPSTTNPGLKRSPFFKQILKLGFVLHFLHYRFRSQNKWRTNSSLRIHTKKEGTSFEAWIFSSLPAPEIQVPK